MRYEHDSGLSSNHPSESIGSNVEVPEAKRQKAAECDQLVCNHCGKICRGDRGYAVHLGKNPTCRKKNLGACLAADERADLEALTQRKVTNTSCASASL